jgi:uncharacterized membrane protein YeaQ/YmgE (transglycosylase-associated protein family)
MELLYSLLLGALVGWIAGLIMKGKGSGLIGNIIIGVVGSVLGHFLFGLVGMSATNTVGRLAVAVAGAILLLVILGKVRKR